MKTSTQINTYLSIFILMVCTYDCFSQNKYRELNFDRTRKKNSYGYNAAFMSRPHSQGIGLGFLYFATHKIQFGGSVGLIELDYRDYRLLSPILNLEAQYDLLKVMRHRVVFTPLFGFGFERGIERSDVNIFIDRPSPFLTSVHAGVNIDIYLSKNFLVFVNGRQGFIYNTPYVDRWRYRSDIGIKYMFSFFN